MFKWFKRRTVFIYGDITKKLYETRRLRGMLVHRGDELPIFIPLFLIETEPEGNEILIETLNIYNPWNQCLIVEEMIEGNSQSFSLMGIDECDYIVSLWTFGSISLEEVSEKILKYSAENIHKLFNNP